MGIAPGCGLLTMLATAAMTCRMQILVAEDGDVGPLIKSKKNKKL